MEAIMRISIEDPKDCGLGEGHNCCAYLVADATGFNCGRVYFSIAETQREKIKEGKMISMRTPILPFPYCQDEGDWEDIARKESMMRHPSNGGKSI